VGTTVSKVWLIPAGLLGTALILKFLRERYILQPAGDYVRITVPLPTSNLSSESARRIAETLKPREIQPRFSPPGLLVKWKPIRIASHGFVFSWQPPDKFIDLSKKPQGRSAEAIREAAKVASKAVAKTRVYRTEAGTWIADIVIPV